MDYELCLNEFKKSLDGGSEFSYLIEGITKNISTNKIRWFDVGLGDGKYLKKIVSKLEELGFEVEVTGIDISETSIQKAKMLIPNGNFYLGDFSTFDISNKYDIFCFNQSLYYFHNKNSVIDKCVKNLSEGGLLIGVAWSPRDKIFQFHKKLFGEYTIGAFSSEDIFKIFKQYLNCKIVYNKLFKGEVNFKRWKKSRRILNQNIHVISRIPLLDNVTENQEVKALKFIKGQKDNSLRANGVILLKKSYELNLDNKKLFEILYNKFPSYKNLIKRMKGDNESKFMASWERETEYLSEKIPRGRILEICCSSGFRSIILAKNHKVTSMDFNNDRLKDARINAKLFNVSKNINFLNRDISKNKSLDNLGEFDMILVDTDWRVNLTDPIKKQELDPTKTTPRTDKLFNELRKRYPFVPIVLKVSPFARVKELKKLGHCIIERLYIDEKFLSYNVYFSPKIKKSKIREIHLFTWEEF